MIMIFQYRYVIHVEYEGVLNDRLHGFYRSTYVNEQGQKV